MITLKKTGKIEGSLLIIFSCLMLLSCAGEQTDNPPSPPPPSEPTNNDTPEVPKLATLTDARDGETYKTTQIGEQVWMIENLRYNAEGAQQNPENPSNEYGRLYDWTTLMAIDKKYTKEEWSGSDQKHQGICPDGWHIPSDEEWNTLEITLGLDAEASGKDYRGTHGKSMKSTSSWDDYNGASGNGDNSSEFNALPAGFYLSETDKFLQLGSGTYFWTSTERNAQGVWSRAMQGAEGVYHVLNAKDYAYSCRCVQD